jgi:transposase-like protein
MTNSEAKPAIAAVNIFAKSPDWLREIVRAVMQEMLEAERTALVGEASRLAGRRSRLFDFSRR